jgi:hypothetical protein
LPKQSKSPDSLSKFHYISKNKFSKMKNTLLIILAFIVGFLVCYLFFCNKPQPHHQACEGLQIPTANLENFMNKSLDDNNIQLEGGFMAKSSLREMIDSCRGDIVRMLITADTADGKFNLDLWLTGDKGGFIGERFNINYAQAAGDPPTERAQSSDSSGNPVPPGKKGCWPCPGLTCCPQSALAAKVDRAGIDYQPEK